MAARAEVGRATGYTQQAAVMNLMLAYSLR
jgi:hypothetical protein